MQQTLSEGQARLRLNGSPSLRKSDEEEEEIHNRRADDSRIKFPNFFFPLPPVQVVTAHQSAGRVVVFLTPASRQVDILQRRNWLTY